MKYLKKFENWYDYPNDNPKQRENAFCWDAKEMLTSHFGTIGLKKEKTLLNILRNGYKDSMINKYSHGINCDWDKIAKLFNLKRDEYDEYENIDDIITIVNGVFDGEL